ncbi:hypothetical protein D3C84_859880 [compost metagenome]
MYPKMSWRVRHPKCIRSGRSTSINCAINVRMTSMWSCTRTLLFQPGKAFKSMSQNSITVALSKTLSLRPWVVSSIFTVPIITRFWGYGIPLGTPFRPSACPCSSMDSPVSIAESNGARYCSGWERFISSRTSV